MLNILRADYCDPRRPIHRTHGAARLWESCEARRVLQDTRVSMGKMLASEAALSGGGRDYESMALGYTDEG
jgi:hypothetical protein